jgi:hypothetical protein
MRAVSKASMTEARMMMERTIRIMAGAGLESRPALSLNVQYSCLHLRG